jgi:hypothetical protein
VVNASNVGGLASKVARTLKHDGYTTGAVRDRVKGEPASTTIEYAPGSDTDAKAVASLLGIDAPDKPTHSLQYGHIEVIVDDNFSVPSSSSDESDSASSLSDQYGYQSSTSGTSSSSSGMGTTTDTTMPTPDQGKPLAGGGVPCVN